MCSKALHATSPPAIVRDKATKEVTFIAPEHGVWLLYGPGCGQEPILEGYGVGTFHIPSVGTAHAYFQLEHNGRRQVLAERHLPMAGGYNFRDLGGIPTVDGSLVRYGRLFRSDGLATLTEDDRTYLSSIPITTVVDFRTHSEAERAPDRLPARVRRIHIPILPGRLDNEKERDDLLASLGGEKLMEFMARALVVEPDIIAGYRKFFQLVQNEENLPLLFHCSAGKDRTGHAAALILLSLGVHRELVMADYMASARYLRGKYDNLLARHPDWEPLFTVKPQYLLTAIDAMDAKSGSVAAYLANELAVDANRMRELFLD